MSSLRKTKARSSCRRQELVLYTDGAARGNPGPAGAGVLITDTDGNPIIERSVFLGQATNNSAEYQALLIGIEEVLRLSPRRVTIKLDSELVVRQLNGQYRVRSPDLIPLYQRALAQIRRLENSMIIHVPREKNTGSDRLANLAIDERGGD